MNNFLLRIIFGIIYVCVLYFGITHSNISFTILFVIIGLMSLNEMYHLRRNKNKTLAFLYIIIPFTLIHQLIIFKSEFEPNLVLGLFILTWIFDSFAYILGIKFGYHKIYPSISPKKSWEGFLSGFIFTLITSYLIYTNISYEILEKYRSLWWGITILLPVTATLGDFIASYYKREANVKDSGKIIPGHGGVLDRMDAFTITIPICYIYIYHI